MRLKPSTLVRAGLACAFLVLLPNMLLAAQPGISLNSLGVFGGLFAGLAVFLLGIEMVAENMRKSAGNSMRDFLHAVTKNRIFGTFGGVVVTVLMQSSSATTVLVVSFAQAHLMSAVQSVSVIIGSNIGSCVTTQLIAFKMTDYSLFIVAAGFFIRTVSKERRIKWIGYGIVGVGFIFLGMGVMSSAMEPLRQEPWFMNLIVSLGGQPLLGMLAGTVLTALIQSSAAFAGIVIALAQQGLISLDAAIPLILGANIGTCITAYLASLQASREAKRVAFIHTFFNVAGVGVFFLFIPQLAALVQAIPGSADPAMALPRQIANAHTIFNIVAAMLFLPFTRQIAALANIVLPVTAAEFSEIVKPKYLDWNLMHTPALAVERVRLEMIYIAELVEAMIQGTFNGFVHNDAKLIARVVEADDNVDRLIAEANRYLSFVMQKPLNEQQTVEARMLASIISDLDHLADLLETMTSRIALRRIEEKIWFSDPGIEELQKLFDGLLEAFKASVEFIAQPDLTNLPKLRQTKQMLRERAEESRVIHYQRMAKGVKDSIASHQMHLDVLNQLRLMDMHIQSMTDHAVDYLEYKKRQ
jgi:phosphate:Na+ symporter